MNINTNNGNDPKLDTWTQDKNVQTEQVKETAEVGVSTQSTISKNQEQTPQQQFSTNASFPKLASPDPNATFDSNLVETSDPNNIIKAFQNLPKPPPQGNTPEEAQSYSDVAVTDPEINNLAEQAGVSPGKMQKSINSQFNNKMTTVLQQGLTKEEASAALFSHFFPEHAATLNPHIKTMLNKAQDQANQSLQKAHGKGDSWKPTNGDEEDFSKQVSNDFDSEFESLLDQYANANDLSSSDQSELLAMHYGEAGPSDNADLNKVFTQLQQQANIFIQTKYNTTPDYQPQANSAAFSQILVGAYRTEIEKAIKNVSPPLSEQDEADLVRYLQDPNADVSPRIKSVAQGLKLKALTNVRTNFGLPDSWSPATDTIQTSAIQRQFSALAQSALSTAKELHQTYSSVLESYPTNETISLAPGSNTLTTIMSPSTLKSFVAKQGTTSTTGSTTAPNGSATTLNGTTITSTGSTTDSSLANLGQVDYKNYLAVVGLQLNKLEQQLYAMEGSNINSSKEMSNVKLDMMENQIAQQARQEQEIKEHQAKMSQLGPLQDMSGWMGDVMVCAVALAMVMITGGMSVMMAAAYMADKIQAQARGATPLFQQMTAAINKACGPIGGLFVNLIISFLLSGENPMLFLQMYLNDSQPAQNFVGVCGGDQTAQQITASVVTMISMTVAGLLLGLCTGGGAIPVETANIMIQGVQISARTAMLVAQIFFLAWTVVQTSMSVAASGIQINNDFQLAAIEKIKAHQEVDLEELQAQIALLSKVIDSVLSALKGTSGFITSIGEFQGQKYNQMSAVTTNLFQNG